ncbi:MAG: hypothetical protein ACFFDN_27055 [Candidatus Hodarchaeota archaeon]
MTQKIVFIGPPGVGKTSLRKIFFEGEYSKTLLEFALEPTHGQESLILDLSESIGIFDLSGQENDRWLESEEKNIFINSGIIVLVHDITAPTKEITNFAKKIVDIRNEICPDAIIYLLIHKIDLKSEEEIIKKKIEVIHILENVNKMKIRFTSIKGDYFTKTFYLFLELIQESLGEENVLLQDDFNLLKNIINFLIAFKEKEVVSKNEILEKGLVSEKNLKRVVNVLLEQKYLLEEMKNGYISYLLTSKGRNYLDQLVKKFSKEGLKILEENYHELRHPEDIKTPPFIAIFIIEEHGQMMMTAEVEKGIVLKHIGSAHFNKKDFDVDLIPLFISALLSFSNEINIANLDGFQLKGVNHTMNVLKMSPFIITYFTNPNINIKPIKSEFLEFINDLIENYEEDFDKVLHTYQVSILNDAKVETINWMRNLNDRYNELLGNLDIIDFNKTKTLYGKLDQISEKIREKLESKLYKIKQLRIELMKATINDDIETIRVLTQKIQKLTSKYLV